MSSPKTNTNTSKLSTSWNNVDETPSDVMKSPKHNKKRDKKRNKTGKSEVRTQELRQKKKIFERPTN